MWSEFLQRFLQLGLLLSLVDGKGTFYGGHGIPVYGNRLRTGLNSQHLTIKPTTRHKNLCAYVVEKNITCPVQDEVTSYVKADFTSRCIWGQKCPVVMYRIVHRPKYRLGLKKVTSLEWRCCPGYTGEQCFHGVPTSPDIPTGTGPFPTGRETINPGINVVTPGVSGERLQRMEEDLRLLTQGLDNLRGVVNGLEERLRTSLQEDINKLLVFLLPSSPRTSESLVGFGAITDGAERRPDGRDNLLGFGTLAESVTEVRDELRAKAHILEEVQGMVLGHDGQLKRLLEGTPVRGPDTYIDEILNRKLEGLRTEIYDSIQNRLTGLENHCNKRIGEVQQKCHQEHMDGQEKIQQTLDGTETGIRQELGTIQAQILGLTTTDSCCGQVNSLMQRVQLLEESVKRLTESQRRLQQDLTKHNNQLEALIQGRVEDTEVEAGSFPGDLYSFRTTIEEKIKTLEKKVLVAVEGLGNPSSPAPLEGQVVPAPETEMESVRRSMEGDMRNIQNQLLDLQLLCTSSCSSSGPSAGSNHEGETMEEKMSERLEEHSEQLDLLNKTLQELLHRRTEEDTEDRVQGEITLLKVNINSVNRTLKGIKDSISFIASEVGQANSTWRQREHQLFDQVQGITKLVGHQASLLGAGERRLAQLKAELVTLRKQLAGDVQGCRSTAVEVKKEVQGFDSRVSQVEKQCNNLGELAEHLERIRAELERHSDWYLAQVDPTGDGQT